MELQELLSRAERIALRSGHLARSHFAGLYKSAFRGLGMEFADVRPYDEGDDIRLIDWNVSARTQSLYVKRMAEERDRHILVVMDVTGSLGFGSVRRTKHDLLVEVAALLILSAFYARDRVSLALAGLSVERYIPAAKGWLHALRLVRELAAREASAANPPSLDPLWAFLTSPGIPRSLVFLLTDLQAPFRPGSILPAVGRRHELVVVLAVDPRERELPNVGRIRVRDPESGGFRVINTGHKAVREGFRREADSRHRTVLQIIESAGADVLELGTDADLDVPLRRFLEARIARRGCRRR
jgi:uncharacterized protein (DUF58 family)